MPRRSGERAAIRWWAACLLLALQAAPTLAETSDRCASDALRAAGLAARDVLEAYVPVPQPQQDTIDRALAKARKRLARRLAKAMHRNACAAPIDVDRIWDLARQFGTDMSSLVVSPVNLTGTWTLMSDRLVDGECADDTPFFADVLEITQHDTSLAATSAFLPYSGGTDGARFYLGVVSGAATCDGGLYDLNLEINGERTAPGTYHVTQRYGHAVIFGTCPPCSVQWEGTMTRAPTPAVTR